VSLEILDANLGTNFQDLVAKVRNLVALVPVLGAILHPGLENSPKKTWVFLKLDRNTLNK